LQCTGELRPNTTETMARRLAHPRAPKHRAPKTRKTTSKRPDRCVSPALGEKRRLAFLARRSNQIIPLSPSTPKIRSLEVFTRYRVTSMKCVVENALGLNLCRVQY